MDIIKTPFAPRPKELDPLEGVGWGNRCSLRLASGPTYHSIELITNITDPSLIERVEVVKDGTPIYNVSGATLVAVQKQRKNYVEAGRYQISFGDSKMRTKIGVRQSDLVTLQGEIWFIYVTLKNSTDGKNTAPSIRARAHVLPAQSQRYYMPRLYELTWFAAAAGRTAFDFSQRSPFFNIKRIHFCDTDIGRVRLLRDSYEEINVNRKDNAFDLASSNLEQLKEAFTIDFTRFGFGADGMLNTAAASELKFELEKTSTGSIPVVIDALEQVNLLKNGE